MGLKFCEHEDVVFDRAPLVVVLCQVRFPPILSLMAAAGIAGFQEALRDSYPTLLPPEQSATIEMRPESVGLKTTAPVWRLTDPEALWTVGVAVDFVSLETPKYTNIDEFLARFDRVLSVARQTIRPADSLRIGLRKVNSVWVPGVDTAELVGVIRPELLGPLAVDHFPTPVGGYFSQLDFREDDNTLAIRYGLETRDDGLAFVLDMDYSTERPQQVEGGNALTGLLRHFSEGMTSFFHWAVEDSYKPQLAPKARQGEPK